MSRASGGVRHFLRELRRRRVVRALLVYLVVAWVLAQVAAITFPALRLPSWTVTFVVVLLALGIPVTMVLAWAYELTPQPQSGEVAEPAGAPVAPAPSRHHATAVGLLGVLLAFAALGSWFAVMRPFREAGARAEGPLPFNRVAVLPFRGAGPGARELAEGMMDLLSLNLGGVEAVRPIDPRAVLARWPADSAVDPNRAFDIAGQLGAGAAILGSVVSIGDRLRIAAELYDVGSRQPLSSAEVEGTEGEAAQLADRLAVELMKQLWSKGEFPAIRLEALTTSDPKALRHYLAGERAYRRGEYALAGSEFRKATELDSTFALAFYRGSISAEWAGRREFVVPLAAAAERHSERLPERYRWLLAARRASYRGDVAEAERLYEQVVSGYPDDVEAWFQLGEIRYHYGPLWGQPEVLALEPFQRALALDGGYPGVYLHLARVAAAGRDSAALEEFTREGLRVEAAGERTVELWTLRAFGGIEPEKRDSVFRELQGLADIYLGLIFRDLAGPVGDLEAAERVAHIVTAPERPRATRAWGQVNLAMLHAGRGKVKAARAALRGAAMEDSWLGAWGSALVAALPFLPSLPDFQSEALRALRVLETRPRLTGSPVGFSLLEGAESQRAFLEGQVALRLGQAGTARSAIARLERM